MALIVISKFQQCFLHIDIISKYKIRIKAREGIQLHIL
jgi:hypothetical protein